MTGDVMTAWLTLLLGFTGMGAMFAVIGKFLGRAGGGFR